MTVITKMHPIRKWFINTWTLFTQCINKFNDINKELSQGDIDITKITLSGVQYFRFGLLKVNNIFLLLLRQTFDTIKIKPAGILPFLFFINYLLHN